MTIKTREPGDAFKRQVTEYMPVKKRRPWRDEEESSASVSLDSCSAESNTQRVVQGAATTNANSALKNRAEQLGTSSAETALEVQMAGSSPSYAKIASVDSSPVRVRSDAISALEIDSTYAPRSSAKMASDGNGVEQTETSATSALVEKTANLVPIDNYTHLSLETPLPRSYGSTAKMAEAKMRLNAAESNAEIALDYGSEDSLFANAISASEAQQKGSKKTGVSSAETASEVRAAGSGPAYAEMAQVDSTPVRAESDAISALEIDSTHALKANAKMASDGNRVERPATSADSALVKNTANLVPSDIGEHLRLENPLPRSYGSNAKMAEAKMSLSSVESSAEMALDSGSKDSFVTNAISASETQQKGSKKTGESSAEIALEGGGDKIELASQQQVNRPAQNLSHTKLNLPHIVYSDTLEHLPGTRRSRSTFVFHEALRRIGQSSAALLYCYLWYQAEEIGSSRLRVTYSEMAEATGIGKRTLFEATKRLAELGLFENINSGKTTTPVVKLKFSFDD